MRIKVTTSSQKEGYTTDKTLWFDCFDLPSDFVEGVNCTLIERKGISGVMKYMCFIINEELYSKLLTLDLCNLEIIEKSYCGRPWICSTQLNY